MNIIIAGDGEVGLHLAEMLASDYHNITIVDPHQELLKMVESQMDLMTITGNSTSIDVLTRANVKRADLLISVLHDEQINIVTCILGKKLGAKRTIARINNVEYLTEKNIKFFHDLGVDELVCPERIAAQEVVKLLKLSAATEIFDFSGGKLSLFLIRLDEKASVLNKTLNQIALENPDLKFRAVAIHRGGDTIIPTGDDKFLLNDLAYVISKPDGVEELMAMSGKEKVDVHDVMIAGGGRIGRKTARELENSLNVKIIEADKERCFKLNNTLKNTLVINGDVRDVSLLNDEDISGMDAFVAVTDNTETNIFTCLMAKKLGVKKVIPLVENVNYIDISQNIGIEAIINKKLITASHIA
ncbi:MAG: Trk system potassium transporter TrkA, partial [Bacteroidales bacterium]|nr:Trk system potassium transporter TrkA [Bacteroidales bacterium]